MFRHSLFLSARTFFKGAWDVSLRPQCVTICNIPNHWYVSELQDYMQRFVLENEHLLFHHDHVGKRGGENNDEGRIMRMDRSNPNTNTMASTTITTTLQEEEVSCHDLHHTASSQAPPSILDIHMPVHVKSGKVLGKGYVLFSSPQIVENVFRSPLATTVAPSSTCTSSSIAAADRHQENLFAEGFDAGGEKNTSTQKQTASDTTSTSTSSLFVAPRKIIFHPNFFPSETPDAIKNIMWEEYHSSFYDDPKNKNKRRDIFVPGEKKGWKDSVFSHHKRIVPSGLNAEALYAQQQNMLKNHLSIDRYLFSPNLIRDAERMAMKKYVRGGDRVLRDALSPEQRTEIHQQEEGNEEIEDDDDDEEVGDVHDGKAAEGRISKKKSSNRSTRKQPSSDYVQVDPKVLDTLDRRNPYIHGGNPYFLL